MKILKIENKDAFYSKDGTNYDSVVNIGREEILSILQLILNSDGAFELDECTDSNPIDNQAEAIIYKNLYSKIKTFIDEKGNIISNNSNLYSESLAKYSDN